MNYLVLRILSTALILQALCLVVGAHIVQQAMIPAEPSIANSVAQSIKTLKIDLIHASVVSSFRNPSIAPSFVEQALANLVRDELQAYLRGQPSIPPDPAEQLSEEVRQQAFQTIEARVDAWLATGEWSEADMRAIAPYLGSITDKQRTAIAVKVHQAIADQRLKPGGLRPPF